MTKQQKFNRIYHLLGKLPSDLINIETYEEYKKVIDYLHRLLDKVKKTKVDNEYQRHDKENLIYQIQHIINYGY